MNTFQGIIIGIFTVFILVAIILFAALRGGSTGLPNIVMWGTVPQSAFDAALSEYNTNASVRLAVTYVEKDKQTFDHDFTEAVASGKGPDAIILPQDMILQEIDKLYIIPFGTLPLRTFKDNFVDESALFAGDNGLVGLPLDVDPLVMYWNRDVVSSAGISAPPKTWNDFFDFAQKVTVKDPAGNITRSAVALGQYNNISFAKPLISILMMQAGTPIVAKQDGVLISVIDQAYNYAVSPAESALRFYTEFSNPVKASYSWNRSLAQDKQAFLSGDLAVYFGLVSENNDIAKKNPNLNFDISVLPQPLGAKNKMTFGQMNALAIVRTSKNVAGTYSIIDYLTSSRFVSIFTKIRGTAPALRSLLSTNNADDPNQPVLYQSALISRAWSDPNSQATDDIFKNMIDSITSGRSRISQTVTDSSRLLDNILRQQ